MMLFGGLYLGFMLWRPDGIIDRRGFPWRSVNVFRLIARQHAGPRELTAPQRDYLD